MPNVKGRVSDVLNDNIIDEFCLVRSKRIEPTSDGIKIDYTRQIPIIAGYVSFVCQPGAAVLIFVDSQRRPTRTIPLLVPDSDITLADAYAAGKILEEEEPQIIERLIQEALTGQAEAKAAAVQAGESATKAAASESAAADSASEALSHKESSKDNATKAEESATKAKQSEEAAAGSATTAKESSESATSTLGEIKQQVESNKSVNEEIKTTAKTVAEDAQKAHDSATNAAASENKAGEFSGTAESAATRAEEAAKTSGESVNDAKGYATQAEEARDTAVSSAEAAKADARTANTSATTAKDHLDTINGLSTEIKTKAEEVKADANSADESADRAEKAAKEASSYSGGEIPESRLSQEIRVKLDSIDGKANKTHKHKIGDVETLQSKLDSKAAKSHKHNIEDITFLSATLDNKADLTHKHKMSDIEEFDEIGFPRAYVGYNETGWTNSLLKNDRDGWLNIFSDPENDNHPTRKSYVDNLAKRNTVCGYVSISSGSKRNYGLPLSDLSWNNKFEYPEWTSKSTDSFYLLDIKEEGFYLVSVNFRSTGGTYGAGIKIGGIMKMKRDDTIGLITSSEKFYFGTGSAGGYVYVSSEGANFGLTMEAQENVNGYFDIAITKMI